MSTRKAVLKVIILGDTDVGKTSIANRYVNNTFTNTYKATIGADIFQKSLYIDDTEVFLTIWDTAGQERFQSLGPGYFRGADACMLVYDTTNAKSFESLKRWHSEFIRTARPDNPETFPFLVLGNKSDLEKERQIRNEDVNGWCKEYDMVNFETSALSGNKVQEVFLELAKKTLKSSQPNLPVYDVERMKAGLYAIDNPPKAPTPEPPREVTPPEPEIFYVDPIPLPPPDYAYGLQNCCGYSVKFTLDENRGRRRRRRHWEREDRERRRDPRGRRRTDRDRSDDVSTTEAVNQLSRTNHSEDGRANTRRRQKDSQSSHDSHALRKRREAIEGEIGPGESEGEGQSRRRRRKRDR